MSFRENYEDTVKFLMELKRCSCATSGTLPGRVAVELASIKKISIGAALVLAAEIDRWRVFSGKRLQPRNLKEWSPQVKGLFDDLGFFELLNVDPGKAYRRDFDESEYAVLPLLSCTSTDGEKIGSITIRLSEVAAAFRQDPLIYGAMTEAAYNCCLHAYPSDHTYEFRPLKQRWWATASWSVTANEVRFLVYDQGVGIAETLPRWHRFEHIAGWMSENFGPTQPFFKDHSRMIEAALEVSRTSLGGGHGKGLQDVVQPIDAYGKGKLRILSGKGAILYEAGGKVTRREHTLHLGGTLIEWTIPVDAEDMEKVA